jgi:hypothetical protein
MRISRLSTNFGNFSAHFFTITKKSDYQFFSSCSSDSCAKNLIAAANIFLATEIFFKINFEIVAT